MTWERGMFARVKKPGFCHILPGTLVRLERFYSENLNGYGRAWEITCDPRGLGGGPHSDGSLCTVVEGRLEPALD